MDFELPKGETWTSDKTIKPLKGEMPALAVSLMDTNSVEHLYWRVIAKNSDDAKSESSARKFQINLKADLE